jgi:hypothetical protein
MTMRDTIGTLTWSRRTGGKLSRREREAFLKAQVARQAQAIPIDQLPGINASDRGQAPMDIDTIRIPDSSVARHAETLVAELSPPFLTHHCHRTYFWGSLLAQHDAIRMDEELFYVASLVHDLGLTAQHLGRHPHLHCFAVEGAMAADAFLARAGWEQARRDIVAEAITLHANPPLLTVDLTHGPVAHYLTAGTLCDAFGQRASEMPKPVIDAVLHRHPGLGFAAEGAALFGTEAQVHPEGRVALSLTHFGLGALFPFDEAMDQAAQEALHA